jgi:hypothetical protein
MKAPRRTALAAALAGVLAAALAGGPAAADRKERSGRNLVPEGKADSALSLSVLALSPGRSAVRSVADEGDVYVGEFVRLCLGSSRDGFVTLWVHSVEGKVSRILPNAFTRHVARGDAIPVRAGVRYCVDADGLGEGGGADKDSPAWGFRVEPPEGTAELYLHWSPTAEAALPGDAFADIDGLAARVAGSGRSAGQHADLWRSFHVGTRPSAGGNAP